MSDHADTDNSPDRSGSESAGAAADDAEHRPPNRLAKKPVIHKVVRWGLGIVVGALATFLTGQLTGGFDWLKEQLSQQTPFTVNVATKRKCPLVFTSPPDEIQRNLDAALKRNPNATLQDLGSLDRSITEVEITVQGRSGKAVRLSDLEPIIDRRDPPTGIAVGGCGGVQPVRLYTVDLDSPVPSAIPAPSAIPDDNTPGASPAPTFSFKVLESEPEVFNIEPSTHHWDCLWRLKFTWTAGRRSGTQIIDNNGEPFRTIAGDGLPQYYLTFDKRFVPTSTG
jgi:hypothetical protein